MLGELTSGIVFKVSHCFFFFNQMYGDFTHLFLYLHIYSSVGLCWTMMIGLRLISQLEREGKKVDVVILLLYNV